MTPHIEAKLGDIAKDVINYRLLAVNPCKITEKDVIEIMENAYE